MAKCGPNHQQVTLDDASTQGYETKTKAKEAGTEAAKKAIRDVGGCTGSCEQPEGENNACIRVADDDDIANAVKITSQKDSDGDLSYYWFLDGKMNTRCMCIDQGS